VAKAKGVHCIILKMLLRDLPPASNVRRKPIMTILHFVPNIRLNGRVVDAAHGARPVVSRQLVPDTSHGTAGAKAPISDPDLPLKLDRW